MAPRKDEGLSFHKGDAGRWLRLDFKLDARFFEKVFEGIVTVLPKADKPFDTGID
jgi:hypothetical protein